MITVVSMSPAIDKRIECDSFSLHKTNRAQHTHTEAAGKGMHVAIAAQLMGLPVRCLGILPGMEPLFMERLRRHGVPFDFLPGPGHVRTNLKLFDRSARQITEVNEPCPAVPPELVKTIYEKIIDSAKKSDYLVLTGSLPEGFDSGWYAEVIQEVRHTAPHCRCVLDADGEKLRLGILSRPWMIKPNLEEMEQLTGTRFYMDSRLSLKRLLSSAREIQSRGIANIVISLGAEGAMAVMEKSAFFAPALPIDVTTTTGAGDAMVAGFLYGLIKNGTAGEALIYAAAAAASRCHCGGDAFFDFQYMLRISAEINVISLSATNA